jgi:hypothetical protein
MSHPCNRIGPGCLRCHSQARAAKVEMTGMLGEENPPGKPVTRKTRDRRTFTNSERPHKQVTFRLSRNFADKRGRDQFSSCWHSLLIWQNVGKSNR